jgi:murein DD-endopeptidase MepM/ murein hydrolase activator NlpD
LLKLRKTRRWTPLLITLAMGFLALAVLRYQAGPQGGPDSAQAVPPLPAVPTTYTEADTVHRGDTLAGLLLRNRMGLQEIDRVLREIRSHEYFSPRSLLPGQVIDFTRNDAGELVRLTCRVSPEQVYVFEMDSDSLRSYAQEVDCEVRVRKLSGPVQSTFEEAILSAGGDGRLAVKVAEVLSGDIDFFTEVRRGDEFSLLVEERYVEECFVGYGEVLYGWYRGDEATCSAVYYRPTGGKGGYYDLEGRSLRRAFLKSPLNYRRISSFFSKNRWHPILKKYRPHHGVDYAAPIGTPVVAVADGTVEYAGWKGGYGRYLKIRHSPTHATVYGHLNRFASGLRKGMRVQQGEKIGYVGKTGLATGPHLHFEVIENGRSINPMAMKTAPAEPIPAEQLPEFRRLAQEMVTADTELAAGSVLEPQAWQGLLLAQNQAVVRPTSN